MTLSWSLLSALIISFLQPAPENLPAQVQLWRNRNFRETTIPTPVRYRCATPHPPYAVDSVIRSDYLINDDRIGGGTQRSPKAAFDTAGSCLAVWEDYRNGNADPIAQWFDINGNRLGETFRPCDDGDMWWHGEPTVGIARNGTALVVWEDRRGGKSNVTAQFYRNGVALDTNFRINDTTPGDKRGCAVTCLKDGRFVVAWEDWRRNNGAIYAQVLDTAARPLGDNFWVNSSGTWQAYGASISSDSSSNFVLVWEDARTGWDVWCQRYNSRAEPLGGNFRVNSVNNRTYNLPTPQIAMSAAGRQAIVWSDFRDDSLHANVYCQLYRSLEDTVRRNFRVNDLIAGSSHLSATVVFDHQENFLVVWTDDRAGNQDIFAQRFDSTGNRLGGNFRVSDDLSNAAQSGAWVRFSPRNEYWVFWTDMREGNPDIYAQRLSLTGELIGSNFRVNDDSFSSHQRVPSIAANASGWNITVWEDERNGNCDVYCQFCDADGNLVGPNIRVNTDNVGAAHFYATAAMDAQGNSIAAWTDGRSGYHIYAQGFDPYGQRRGDNFRVNEGIGMGWSPSAAMDSAGNSVIIWQDLRTGSFKMFGQRYNAQLQPIGGNFRIDTDTTGGWLQYGSVAMSPTGRFVVAWMDQRHGASIYARLFDSTGAPRGPDFRCNDNEEPAYMGYPVVAMDRQGNFVVVWEDNRNRTHTDIYAQRFDADGNRLGINFCVNEDPTESDQYSPSVAMDAQGRFIILWNDWRDVRKNPEIYVQRHNAQGSRIGGNAVINEPCLFYYQHHWSMQRSVAAGGERLYFTWTENRRHRGWDNYNKVTDWNLVALGERQVSAARSGLDLQIAPNPVGRKGVLRVRGSRQQLTVRLYDATGRQRAILYDGVLVPPGLELSFRLPSSGTYFVIARAGPDTAVRKIVTEAD